MMQSEQPSRIYQSYNQQYYLQTTQQKFRPSQKQQFEQRQFSPFQSLNEEMFSIPQKQFIINEKSSYFFYNPKDNSPQNQTQQAIQVKEYFQKPFGRIPQFKINEIQILIPEPTARFRQNTHQSNYPYKNEQMDKSPREGVKKKKISIVTKTLTPRSQKV